MKKFNLLLVEFGTMKNISDKLKVGQTVVYLWKQIDLVPIKYLRQIEELSEGRISPWDLRPDLLPNMNKPGITFDQTNVNAEEQEPIIQPPSKE